MRAKRSRKAPVPRGLIWWKGMQRHPLNLAVGVVVHEQRGRRGWSLDDLHEATGIAKSHLWNLEHGRHTISLDMILTLEAVFGMVPNGLLTLGRRRLGRSRLGRMLRCSV